MGFKVGVVLLAFIACVRDNVLAACPVILLELPQERDERVGVGRLRPDACPEDEFGVAAVLDVVSGLELAVPHGVLLHTHEGRVLVGLCKAVASLHVMELGTVVLEPCNIAFELFEGVLERRLPLPRTVDKDNAVF